MNIRIEDGVIWFGNTKSTATIADFAKAYTREGLNLWAADPQPTKPESKGLRVITSQDLDGWREKTAKMVDRKIINLLEQLARRCRDHSDYCVIQMGTQLEAEKENWCNPRINTPTLKVLSTCPVCQVAGFLEWEYIEELRQIKWWGVCSKCHSSGPIKCNLQEASEAWQHQENNE